MAKIAYSKLGLKVPTETQKITWNDVEIEIKQYLPVEDKLKIVEDVTNRAFLTDDKVPNWGCVSIYFTLAVVENYTNISFTEKQLEDVNKLFDALTFSGLYGQILNAMPETEYGMLQSWINSMINEISTKKKSIVGMMEAISTDYSNLEFDAEALQETLANPESLSLLKDVLGKMG